MPSRDGTTVRQGFITGLVGFVTVMAVFVISDILAGRPAFHTPGTLGYALFGGDGDASRAPYSAVLIAGYTVVHLAVFLIFGFLAVALARLADRGWQLWFVGLFVMLFVGFHLFAAVQSIAVPAGSAISDVMIWIAGFGASATMAWYLLRAHPLVRGPQPW